MIKKLFRAIFQLDNKLPKNTNKKLGESNPDGYTATMPDFIEHSDGLMMVRTDGRLYRLTTYDKVMLICRMISLENFDQMICNS